MSEPELEGDEPLPVEHEHEHEHEPKPPPQDPEAQKKAMWIGVGLLVFVGLNVLVWPLVLKPTSYRYRGGGNETAAIGALKTIGTAQSLYREADKEADGNLDYGTLEELANSGTTGLIDQVLGSGTKNGYLFQASYGAMTSEFIWFAVATPAIPTTTGDRYFATNHEGVTYYTTLCAFSLNTIECTIPQGAVPVGR